MKSLQSKRRMAAAALLNLPLLCCLSSSPAVFTTPKGTMCANCSFRAPPPTTSYSSGEEVERPPRLQLKATQQQQQLTAATKSMPISRICICLARAPQEASMLRKLKEKRRGRNAASLPEMIMMKTS